jgi:hypothetical protein
MITVIVVQDKRQRVVVVKIAITSHSKRQLTNLRVRDADLHSTRQGIFLLESVSRLCAKTRTSNLKICLFTQL